MDVARGNRATHFFSNITLSPLGPLSVPDNSSADYFVVDGQQRLTTLSLFLQAIKSVLHEYTAMVNDCLMSGYMLKLSFEDSMDQRTYRHLLMGRFCEPESVSAAMVQNLKLFEKEIENYKEELRKALDNGLLDKLLFVKVELPPAMPPQRVFERMNGVRLQVSTMDLIKNWLLMEAGLRDEQEVYEKWETGFGSCHRYFWIMAAMHAKKPVAEEDIFKQFREFVRGYLYDGVTVIQILSSLKVWIAGFDKVSESFARLNGNYLMGHNGLRRFGPLLMKIAIVFPSEDEAPCRNELVARIVEHQRQFIAAERLHCRRIHVWSWDASRSNECLRKSGDAYGKAFLERAISETFQPYPRDIVDENIRGWFDNKDPNCEPRRNADIIGLLPEGRTWTCADDLVNYFHDCFATNKQVLASETALSGRSD